MLDVLENKTMATRITLYVAGIILALSAIVAVIWWIVVWRIAPFPDWRVWLILAGVAVVQIAAWVVVLLLFLRVREHPSFILALTTAVLGLVSLFAHLVNGFTPAIGGPISLLVLCLGLLGLAVASRLSKPMHLTETDRVY